MKGGVYLIRNNVSGREYVGSSVDVGRRFAQHRNRLKAGAHHNPMLQHAWSRRGADAFEFSVLESVGDPALLVEREQWHIDARQPAYNMAPAAGSVLGLQRSPATRARMSAGLIGNQNGRGRVRAPEERARVAAALAGNTHTRGKTMPPSFSATLSARNLGNTYGSAQQGVPKSAAHRAACALGQKRRWAKARGEAV